MNQVCADVVLSNCWLPRNQQIANAARAVESQVGMAWLWQAKVEAENEIGYPAPRWRLNSMGWLQRAAVILDNYGFLLEEDAEPPRISLSLVWNGSSQIASVVGQSMAPLRWIPIQIGLVCRGIPQGLLKLILLFMRYWNSVCCLEGAP